MSRRLLWCALVMACLALALVHCDIDVLDLRGYPCEGDADCRGWVCRGATAGKRGVCRAKDWIPEPADASEPADFPGSDASDASDGADFPTDVASPERPTDELSSESPGVDSPPDGGCRAPCSHYRGVSSTNKPKPGSELSVDSRGNVYIYGRFWGSITFGNRTYSAKGSHDIYLAKYGPNGALLWSKHLAFQPKGSTEEDWPLAILHANDALYLAGYSLGVGQGELENFHSVGSGDAFLLKLDPASGKLLWLKQYGSPNGKDSISGIAADANGDLFLIGAYRDLVSFDANKQISCNSKPDSQDLFLFKMKPSGEGVWVQCWGGKGWDARRIDPNGSALSLSPNGKTLYTLAYVGADGTKDTLVQVGSKTFTTSGRSGLLVGVDPSTGQVQQLQPICHSPQRAGECWPYELRVDSKGRLLIAGQFQGTQELLTGKTYTSSHKGAAMDHFIFQASFQSDGSLKVHWLQILSQSTFGTLRDFVLHPKTDNLLVTGSFAGALELGKTRLRTENPQELYLLELSQKDGEVLRSLKPLGVARSEGFALHLSAAGTLYLNTLLSGPARIGKQQASHSGSGFDSGLWILPHFQFP